MEKANYFSIALVEIFPGGQEMKMHLRSSRVETVQTVEKRERKGEWRSWGAGMLDNKNIAQNMETRLDQAFTSKM